MDKVTYKKFRKQDRFSWKKIRRAFYRFCIYGSFVIFFEVLYYTTVKTAQMIPVIKHLVYPWIIDPNLGLGGIWSAPYIALFGMSSLWMFFVYGAVGVFGLEPAFRRINKWNWFFRGLIYMVIIMAFDWTTGFLLRVITGYNIWINPPSPLTIFGNYGYTSLAIAPMWFAMGLLSENLIRLVERFTELKFIVQHHNIPDRVEE